MPDTPHPAQLAKGALRRLAQNRREPTPENYARAYAEELGLAPGTAPAAMPQPTPAVAAPPPAGWAVRLDAMVGGLDRGGRHWTLARRKDSLRRLLDRSGSDDARLASRLDQLLAAWDADRNDRGEIEVPADEADRRDIEPGPAQAADAVDAWPLIDALQLTVGAALPDGDPEAGRIADELARLSRRIAAEGPSAEIIAAVDAASRDARRVLGHRHRLVDELLALCRSLTDGLTDIAEDPAWVHGHAEGLRQRLDQAPGTRAVRAARELFEQARQRQRQLRTQREQARDALKATIAQMLVMLGELDAATGRFGQQLSAQAAAIESADSLESLATLVRGLLGDSRELQSLVAAARSRLAAEHERSGELHLRVQALEAELRRIADEATTDALTQVANRRGLAQVFEAESARIARAGDAAPPLAVALLDIDNFKRLNDTLGHAAGDEALRALVVRVKAWLRPQDHLARYGGEEFVVLLPASPVQDAQQALTRLQRQLSASLFMHDGQEVFVTFSAGVTAHRPGEAIEAALERADEALYEAKRTGKNRTCIA